MLGLFTLKNMLRSIIFECNSMRTQYCIKILQTHYYFSSYLFFAFLVCCFNNKPSLKQSLAVVVTCVTCVKYRPDSYMNLPGLIMWLCPDKLIVSWKYHKSKIHVIHLTCLKRAQNTYISLQLGKHHLIQSLFYNTVLNISCNLLNTVLKVKTEWLYGYRMAVSVLVFHPHDLWLTGSFSLLPVPDIMGEHLMQISSPQRIKIQNLKYSFNWMPTAFTPS